MFKCKIGLSQNRLFHYKNTIFRWLEENKSLADEQEDVQLYLANSRVGHVVKRK